MSRRTGSLLGLFLLVSLVPLVSLVTSVSIAAQVGSVLRQKTISTATGFFGAAIVSIGDLDGDGNRDIAVGAPSTNDGGRQRGAILILFLAADGSLLSSQAISQTQGGFVGTLANDGFFGGRIANVGDLDGDGLPELVTFSGGPNRLWVLFLKKDGTLKAQNTIQFTDPAFVPATSANNFDGEQIFPGLEGLGDLDGDGLGDLAVGSPFDPDGGGFGTGAVWILRLSATGTIKAAHKISQLHGGFVGNITLTQFGTSITQLGDLDGDGNRELAVTTAASGPVWILELDANELVKNQHEYPFDYAIPGSVNVRFLGWLGDLDGDGFGEIALGYGQNQKAAIGFLAKDGSIRKRLHNLPFNAYRWGPLGDLDGDGNPEIAAGDPNAGKLIIASLDANAERNGTGVNPAILSQTKEPVFGKTWTVTLDCTGHAPGLAAIYGFSAKTAATSTSFGEVLVGGTQVFYVLVPHNGGPTPLSVGIPPSSISLVDLDVHVQGAITGAPHPQLSNALDVLLGK